MLAPLLSESRIQRIDRIYRISSRCRSIILPIRQIRLIRVQTAVCSVPAGVVSTWQGTREGRNVNECLAYYRSISRILSTVFLKRLEIYDRRFRVEVPEPGSLASVYDGWAGYNTSLVHAIEPLTSEQLAFKPFDGQRTVGEIARHISLGRLNWFMRMNAPRSAELCARIPEWTQDRDGNRHIVESSIPIAGDAAELVEWLNASGDGAGDPRRVDCRGPGETYRHTYWGTVFAVTRQWTIWRTTWPTTSTTAASSPSCSACRASRRWSDWAGRGDPSSRARPKSRKWYREGGTCRSADTVPSLCRTLSNIMAAPSSAEPETHAAGLELLIAHWAATASICTARAGRRTAGAPRVNGRAATGCAMSFSSARRYATRAGRRPPDGPSTGSPRRLSPRTSLRTLNYWEPITSIWCILTIGHRLPSFRCWRRCAASLRRAGYGPSA